MSINQVRRPLRTRDVRPFSLKGTTFHPVCPYLSPNVVIDFMGEREGFFDDAAAIFAMIEDGIITASVSALIIVNCAYILKKAFSSDVMLDKVVALCQMLNVAPIDRSQLVNAAQLRPYNYEDAVQYLSALPYHPDVLKRPSRIGKPCFDFKSSCPASGQPFFIFHRHFPASGQPFLFFVGAFPHRVSDFQSQS